MSADARSVPAHHFDSPDQQREAATLGMWVFLVTEVMFFGGLFLAYVVYRWSFPHAFAAASRELDIVLGTTNTAVLIASSLTMALAVRSAQLGRRRPSCAERTASAIVRLLAMRTAVFVVPRTMSSSRLAAAKECGNDQR